MDGRQGVEYIRSFEGTYTAEEISLNQRLRHACTNEIVDFALVESLLQQGADPLGGLAESGLDLMDHVYGEILCDGDSKNLPRITELFLQYGMDIEKPRIPYDDDDSLHPMWCFAFVQDEYSARALKMLLDSGLSADSAGAMWGHSIGDILQFYDVDPNSTGNDTCTWALKLMLLCASYDHVLDNDPDLQKEIGCAYNSFDTHLFRDWNRFTYTYDTSRCHPQPELYRSVVHVYDTVSQKEVWKIGFGVEVDEI